MRGISIMIELEMKIKEYMLGRPAIKIEMDEDMEIGEILDARRDFTYGQVELSDEGKLVNVLIDMEEIMEHNDIALDEFESLELNDLIEMAQEFAEDFFTSKIKYVNTKQWVDDTYLMTFEQFDNTLQLPIPQSGVRVEINSQGFVSSATFNHGYYQLTYPEIEITASQAKDILRKETLLTTEVEQGLEDLTVVYVPKLKEVVVGVNGRVFEKQTLEDDGESLESAPFEKVEVSQSLPQLLGITADMVLEDEEGVQVWHTLSDEDSSVIRINERNANEATYESVTPWKHIQTELSVAELTDRAKQFLELTVGNIHEKFELEEQMPEEELTEEELAFFKELEANGELDDDEDDEDDENDFEPFRTFSFIRKVSDITLDEYNVHVDVGVYTGIVRDSNISRLDESLESTLNSESTVSLKVANSMYVDFGEVRLVRVIESNDDFPIYTLAYEICYNDGELELLKIDAQTGQMEFEENVK